MANWTSLKAAIDLAIRTNRKNEITGSILNSVLNAIVSNLGGERIFAGVAVPTTSPGAPDGNVFYIATKAGNYVNFSGYNHNGKDLVIFENTSTGWTHTLTGISDIVPDLSDDITGLGQRVSAIETSGWVSTSRIANSAVTAAKLGTSAVTEGKIAAGAVTTAKIGDLNVTEAKIAAGAVTSTKIGDLGVTTGKIANLGVTEAKIAAGAVTTAKISDSNVTEPKIASGAVTNDKLANESVSLNKLDSFLNTAINHAADLAGEALGEIADLKNGGIDSTALANSAVINSKIADGAVTETKLADASVGNSKLQGGAVASMNIANNAVSTEKIADNAVSSSKIAGRAVDNTKLSSDLVNKPLNPQLILPNIGTAGASVTIGAGSYISWTDLDGESNTVQLPTERYALLSNRILVFNIESRTILSRSMGTVLAQDVIIAYADTNGTIYFDTNYDLYKKVEDLVSGEIPENTLDGSKLVDGSVDGSKITANSVDGDKILNGSVSDQKLSSTLLSNVTQYRNWQTDKQIIMRGITTSGTNIIIGPGASILLTNANGGQNNIALPQGTYNIGTANLVCLVYNLTTAAIEYLPLYQVNTWNPCVIIAYSDENGNPILNGTYDLYKKFEALQPNGTNNTANFTLATTLFTPTVNSSTKTLDLGASPYIYVGGEYIRLYHIWPDNPEKYRAIPLTNTVATHSIILFDLVTYEFTASQVLTGIDFTNKIIFGSTFRRDSDDYLTCEFPFDFRYDNNVPDIPSISQGKAAAAEFITTTRLVLNSFLNTLRNTGTIKIMFEITGDIVSNSSYIFNIGSTLVLSYNSSNSGLSMRVGASGAAGTQTISNIQGPQGTLVRNKIYYLVINWDGTTITTDCNGYTLSRTYTEEITGSGNSSLGTTGTTLGIVGRLYYCHVDDGTNTLYDGNIYGVSNNPTISAYPSGLAIGLLKQKVSNAALYDSTTNQTVVDTPSGKKAIPYTDEVVGITGSAGEYNISLPASTWMGAAGTDPNNGALTFSSTSVQYNQSELLTRSSGVVNGTNTGDVVIVAPNASNVIGFKLDNQSWMCKNSGGNPMFTFPDGCVFTPGDVRLQFADQLYYNDVPVSTHSSFRGSLKETGSTIEVETSIAKLTATRANTTEVKISMVSKIKGNLYTTIEHVGASSVNATTNNWDVSVGTTQVIDTITVGTYLKANANVYASNGTAYQLSLNWVDAELSIVYGSATQTHRMVG